MLSKTRLGWVLLLLLAVALISLLASCEWYRQWVGLTKAGKQVAQHAARGAEAAADTAETINWWVTYAGVYLGGVVTPVASKLGVRGVRGMPMLAHQLMAVLRGRETASKDEPDQPDQPDPRKKPPSR